MTIDPSNTSPLQRTRFERFVEANTGSVVFFIVIIGISKLIYTVVMHFWPGLATADTWVQIGWGLLTGTFAGIWAWISAQMTDRWTRRWAASRAVARWCEAFSRRWDANHE